jgi:cell wall assembly regulator SMI1
VDPVPVSWKRIDGWLQRHAPSSALALAGPADPIAIDDAAEVLDLPFPPAVRDSLRCHDGLRHWANVLPEGVPLSLAGIIEHRQLRMEIARVVDGFAVRPVQGEPWWDPRWLPFADSEGDTLFVDLRPGPGHGRVGLAIHDGAGSFEDGWPSLEAYFSQVADALELGGNVGAWHPYLTLTGELWWSLEGQTELNGEPLRPAPTG